MKKPVRITFRLTNKQAIFLSEAGKGNASRGIRTAVEFAQFYRDKFAEWLAVGDDGKEVKHDSDN